MGRRRQRRRAPTPAIRHGGLACWSRRWNSCRPSAVLAAHAGLALHSTAAAAASSQAAGGSPPPRIRPGAPLPSVLDFAPGLFRVLGDISPPLDEHRGAATPGPGCAEMGHQVSSNLWEPKEAGRPRRKLPGLPKVAWSFHRPQTSPGSCLASDQATTFAGATSETGVGDKFGGGFRLQPAPLLTELQQRQAEGPSRRVCMGGGEQACGHAADRPRQWRRAAAALVAAAHPANTPAGSHTALPSVLDFRRFCLAR